MVNFVVTGSDDYVLNTKVVDIYGEERRLPDVSLGSGDVSRGSLAYEVFGGRSFGVFRVEAWLEDQTGRRVSPVNEIVVIFGCAVMTDPTFRPVP